MLFLPGKSYRQREPDEFIGPWVKRSDMAEYT